MKKEFRNRKLLNRFLCPFIPVISYRLILVTSFISENCKIAIKTAIKGSKQEKLKKILFKSEFKISGVRRKMKNPIKIFNDSNQQTENVFA
jgi:hypothetical protein